MEHLTHCEGLIMSIIWNEEKGEIPTFGIIDKLSEKHGKEYARTTIVTFITRLVDKGYVVKCKRGRIAYIQPVISQEQYLSHMLKEIADFWYGGSTDKMINDLKGVYQDEN